MSIKRLLSNLVIGAMDSYSKHMYNHTFDVEYKAAARFLAKHPQPELSQADKDEIDRYWRKFGFKYPDYTWFQMFYGVSDIHDPRFIPDFLAWPPIYWHYNDKTCFAGWVDKNLATHLVPNIKFTTDLAHIYRGKVYDKDWNYCPNEHLPELCNSIYEEIKNDNMFVLKQTRSTSEAKGVKFIEIEKPEDILTAITQNITPDHVLQRCIRQSSFMSQFCESSINVFRVNTWRHNGKIEVLPSTTLRYGVEGVHTDVTFINGEHTAYSVGINPDGTLNNKFVALSGKSQAPKNFKDPVIPNYEAILDMAKRGHESLFPFDFVGWDIALDQDNNPVCIEYNLYRPGTTIYQYANGPLAGEFTDELLSFLNEGDNLERFIPKKYRTR